MASPIARYLDALRRQLAHDPLLARRLCAEVADHLAELAAADRSHGMSAEDAEEAAVRRFGAPETLARQFQPLSFPLRVVLVLGSLATGAIALWLCFVVAVVLPERDPTHVGMWTGFAAGFLVYAGLTLMFVLARARPPWLPASVVILSLGAIAFGSYAIASMVRAAGTGGHFEGYLLVMGAVLAGHGLCALAYAALSAWIGRQVRAG